ncbi:hypothetical protein TNCV_2584421 [Trichonephila clavipes]|nr:hypothetical protein TNCV_2584421 [Trichonephila clavipes]
MGLQTGTLQATWTNLHLLQTLLHTGIETQRGGIKTGEKGQESYKRAIGTFLGDLKDKVCELHFSDDAIRRYTEAYNEKTGEKICVPLKRFRLQNFAVPTIFTDFPAYLSNSGNPARECPEQRLQRLENEHLQRSIQASIISRKNSKKRNHLRRFQN